jgi:hypothetical protein
MELECKSRLPACGGGRLALALELELKLELELEGAEAAAGARVCGPARRPAAVVGEGHGIRFCLCCFQVHPLAKGRTMGWPVRATPQLVAVHLA